MPLIVTAEQILAAIGTDEDDPFETFVEDYKQLHADGLTDKDIAIALGLTEYKVNHRLRRARKAGLLPPANPKFRSAGPLADDWTHGTKAGYHRHQRRGEQPCEACRAGKRAYDRDHTRRSRQVAA